VHRLRLDSMKRALYVVLCVTFLAPVCVGAAPPTEIARMQWLVGRSWSANPDGALGKVARIDTRYEWSSTGNVIRFDTQFVDSDGTVERRYSGMFYLDPKGGPSVWYIDQNGAITQGRLEVTTVGVTMHLVDSGGTYRVDVLRSNQDAYDWQLFAQDHGDWTKVLALVFRSREPGS
jgi:hypothetical protein